MSEILTHTRVMIDPVHPEKALIDIRDIAHALSMLCRANGHFPTFYSVGQHSINCMREAAARGYSRRVQLACLTHDGSEAYLADITRPVKKELPKYLEIEEPLQALIWEKFLDAPLTEEEYRRVFEIDDAVLYYEFLTLMGMALAEKAPELKTLPELTFSGFRQTEEEFLACFRQLSRETEEPGTGKGTL